MREKEKIMELMKTSEVLDSAADWIERRGWTRGTGWNTLAGGPLCLEPGAES